MTIAAAPLSERTGWLIPAGALVLAITGLRVWLLSLNGMDLFVDEAQYWLWGQELAFGYYSKPPMIGWVIRAVTDLAGSDAPFWVRLPAPLFHGATALVLGWIAAGLWGARAAVLVAAGYATLPMVAAGSILISTDTILFPFLALALAGWLRVLDGGGRGWAVATGVALGLGFLSKYAAIYFLICAPLAALLFRQARPRLVDVLTVLGVFALTISPNVIWNLVNGFSTLEHTLDNADWVRDPGGRTHVELGSLAEFLASQAGVFGPILFGGLIWLTVRAGRADFGQRLMLIFSLPILVLICGQALVSGAYANWAATAYLAGTLAVLPWLRPAWRWASFAVNGTVALALPVMGAFPWAFAPGGEPLLARYLGRAEMSAAIIATAKDSHQDIVVAENRDVLADLFYSGRNSGLTFFAVPSVGRAPNHYALKHPLPPGAEGDVLFVASGQMPPCARDETPLAEITPDTGAYRGKRFTLYVLPASCWYAAELDVQSSANTGAP